MRSLPVLFLLPVLATVFSACKEDPKLVEKREQQKAEIVRLRGELALLDEKLRNLPEDVSAQLAQAEAECAEQKTELTRLEAETTQLDTRKRELQKEFDAYRAKYPAR